MVPFLITALTVHIWGLRGGRRLINTAGVGDRIFATVLLLLLLSVVATFAEYRYGSAGVIISLLGGVVAIQTGALSGIELAWRTNRESSANVDTDPI